MNVSKFKVGEEVILNSPKLQTYSGDYFVERVISPKEFYKCRLTNLTCRSGDKNFTYLLSTPVPYPSESYEALIAETSLRKKHYPSSQSFNEMMNTLKSPLKDKDKVK